MAQGTPFRCLPWHPPDFKVLGGGKGEVKPPKCPTTSTTSQHDIGNFSGLDIRLVCSKELRSVLPCFIQAAWPVETRAAVVQAAALKQGAEQSAEKGQEPR